jgi:hypothetical protein
VQAIDFSHPREFKSAMVNFLFDDKAPPPTAKARSRVAPADAA